MKHLEKLHVLILLLLLTQLTAIPAFAALPKPDMNHLPAYIQALKQSKDPEAAQILKEIDDGPAALAYQEKLTRAAGIPLTQAEVAQPQPPPGQNAAPLYQKLHMLLQTKPLGLPMYAQPLAYGYIYSHQQLAEAQQIVSSRSDVFGLTDQAAALEAYVPARTSAVPDIVDFPAFAEMRESARELNTQSYLLAEHGKYAEAVKLESLGYNIGRQAASGPDMIGDLVAVAIDAITTGGMQGILDMAGPNNAVDTDVQQAVSANTSHFLMRRALNGDMVQFLTLLLTPPPVEEEALKKQLIQMSPKSVKGMVSGLMPQGKSSTPAQAQAQIFKEIADAAAARYLAYMRPLIVSVSKPGMSRSALVAALSVKPDGGTPAEQAYNPVSALYANTTMLNYGQFENTLNLPSVEEHVTEAAAAVLAAKANTRAFPASLPGMFIDPYDNKQLGYRREGDNGFVVYSVGSKGTFDGGKPGQYQHVPFQTFYRYPPAPLQPIPPDELRTP